MINTDYYPKGVSMPPVLGEYVYYSKKIQNFKSEIFYCVRPRWIVEVKNFKDKIFYVHFSSSEIIPDKYECVCVGICTKIVEKLDLINMKKNLTLECI